MDDLKLLLYLFIAIGWFIYSNFKKLNEAAKKRNPGGPHGAPGHDTGVPVPQPASVRTEYREIKKAQAAKSRPHKFARKPGPDAGHTPFLSGIEGGELIPSKIVHFEELSAPEYSENPILLRLKTIDLQSAVLWGEILKRPYN